MLPGPTTIKRCPGCKGLLAEGTLASGNTLGATFWTDGKREAPMLPEMPWLVGRARTSGPATSVPVSVDPLPGSNGSSLAGSDCARGAGGAQRARPTSVPKVEEPPQCLFLANPVGFR